MFGAAIIIILAIAWAMNLGGQAISTYNVKQEGHRRMQEGQEDFRRRNKELSHTWNLYYDDRTGDLNEQFYRDGSVRLDYRTHRMYDMGRYFYNADGYNCRHEKAPAGAELAPRLSIHNY